MCGGGHVQLELLSLGCGRPDETISIYNQYGMQDILGS
jgi:hypothetical protein